MAESGFLQADSNNLPNIDTYMIMEFINESDCYNTAEIRGLKAEFSMRSSYVNSAVGYVQVKRTGPVCTVLGQICPEHRIRISNYKVKLLVDEEKEKVTEVKCLDCAASEGGCKHALAFLMWAHLKSSQPAPTEVECYWKKPKLSGAANESITTEAFGVPPTANISSEDANNFFKETIKTGKELNCSSELFKYFSNADGPNVLSMHTLMHTFVAEFGETHEDFLTFCETAVKESLCKSAASSTLEQSHNKLWFELRYGRITASKISSAASCKTEDGVLVNSIIGASKMFQSKAMKRGLDLEDKVRRVVEKKLDIKIKKCGLILNCKYPEFGASPDGVTDSEVFEIKCPASPKTFNNYLLQDGKISLKCKAQLHLQMLLLNYKVGYLCVAHPCFETSNKVDIVKINFDEIYVTEIIENSRKFWKKYIFPRLIKTVK